MQYEKLSVRIIYENVVQLKLSLRNLRYMLVKYFFWQFTKNSLVLNLV